MKFQKFVVNRLIVSSALCLIFSAGVHAEDSASSTVKKNQFTLMSYNVQNLFDTVDSPDTNDSEFTRTGAQKWTEEVVNDKVKNLSKVILSADSAIVALVEVENQEMVERLRDGMGGKEKYPTAITMGSDDLRGIRNGIISRFPVKSQESHRVWRDSWKDNRGETQKTRDILEVTLVAGHADGREILVTVLVNHWPSRAGGPARERMRTDAARTLAEVAKSITDKDPDRLVIAAGDFNDELEDASFKKGLNLVPSIDALAKADAGSFFAIDSIAKNWAPEDKGTFYYYPEKAWNTLDHVLVAEGAKLANNDSPGFHYVDKSFGRVKPTDFIDTKLGTPQGCEINAGKKIFQGRKGNACPTGASDHFPLVSSFELR